MSSFLLALGSLPKHVMVAVVALVVAAAGWLLSPLESSPSAPPSAGETPPAVAGSSSGSATSGTSPSSTSSSSSASSSTTSSATSAATGSTAASGVGAASAGPAGSAGSASVGSVRYPVPAQAIFVSPAGQDSNAGTLSAPVRTLATALSLAPSGGTVVMRGGTYHESVSVTSPVTIENYPGESVWLDGSSRVSGFVATGTSWTLPGWSYAFDHSPTFTSGAPDGTSAGWQFVDPKYPMAPYPDQLWVDGRPLAQVSAGVTPRAGQFSVNTAAHTLQVGSNPNGHLVEASTLQVAMNIRAAHTTVRGIGVRRYADSVPQMGAITIESPSVTLENVDVEDMATSGLFVGASSAVLRDVTVNRSGMLGVGGNYAYSALFDGVRVTNSNTQHFNLFPVAGGIKLARSRGVVVRNSVVSGNDGTGIWFDESSYGMTITGNTVANNAGHGIAIEISGGALIANNLIINDAQNGLKINDANDVRIWNNTIVGTGRPINIVQDSRTPNRSWSDARRPFPDPTVTLLTGPVSVMNNVVAAANGSANCLLCVEDYTHQRSAAQMHVTANSNVCNRPSKAPAWLVVWSRGGGDPAVYFSLKDFVQATGQERAGLSYDGTSVVSRTTGVLSAPVQQTAPKRAQALPADIARAVGLPTGSRHLGAWLPLPG